MMAALIWRPNLEWTPEASLSELLHKGLLRLHHAVPLYAAGLFVLCMFVHGELVARRPPAAQLTRFYLMVSLGGALGGLLVGIAAPLAFDYYWEMPAALLAVPVAVLLLRRAWLVKAAGLATLAACSWLGYEYAAAVRDTTIAMSRNFYGTLRVKAEGGDEAGGDHSRWRLLHGVIEHGFQYRSPERRHEATSYYGETAGIGQALLGLRAIDAGAPQHVGLIGLGVGTLARYGRAGDRYRFYELNPQVLALARSHFSYLADSKARIETALGDARLVLEREAPQRFDLLAVDAFSSDSIPVHLITRQALAVYVRHLREGGVVAFHVSNLYLDLEPVVQAAAETSGMKAWAVDEDPPPDSPRYKSNWVLVTKNEALLEWLREREAGALLDEARAVRAWSDDHNNLFEVLR
jgi:spermidine synthase